MKRRVTWWLLSAAILAGVGLGLATQGQKAEAVDQQALFQAVESWLTAAHVPRQDMPKAVLAVRTLPNGHYLVHMQMVVGEGWFEVWQEGATWQVKGAQPPRP